VKKQARLRNAHLKETEALAGAQLQVQLEPAVGLFYSYQQTNSYVRI
jgi:hypothetical protein